MNRTYNEYYQDHDDEGFLLDLDDLDQDEADCLAALAVHNEGLARRVSDDY